MARPQRDTDSEKKKVQTGFRLDPRFLDMLEDFGIQLRELEVSTYGTGGRSNALDAILEMAEYMDWFDEPEKFAAELMMHRAKALARKADKKS